MSIRETEKIIELSGRKWKVGRFDAQTGSFIAYQLMSTLLPMGMGAKVGAPTSGLPPMTREQFTFLQNECLKVCAEVAEVGGVQTPLPVIMQTGAWGVEGLENDIMTVLGLTIHALIFNVSCFFDAGALTELTGSLKDFNPFNLPT